MEMAASTFAQPRRDPRISGARPEQELLIVCATTRLEATRRARIRALLEQPIDWQYATKTAERHGLLPLLYVNLRSVCPEAVPETVLDELQVRFRKNAISNLLLASETRSILNLFAAHGIAAIPFKGPTLAASAYGDIARRQFHDTDLLIHRADAREAKRLLLAQGYTPDHRLTPAQETAFLKSECEYTFKNVVYVELQWEIVPRNHSFTINDEGLWQRARQIEIEGATYPMLAAEDLLLILCAHGTKHGWSRLAWITDIGEVIASSAEMDWQSITERAGRRGGERMLWLGLWLASELTGATLPGWVAEKIVADGVVKQLGAQVCEHLFDEPGDSPPVIENAQFYIRARERWRDRWRCYVRMALAPTVNDISFLRLPRALQFLYYPLRPIRLIVKYAQRFK